MKKIEWISVKDALPEEGQTIICLWNYGKRECIYEDNVGSWKFSKEFIAELTYWMPLPSEPKKDM